MLRSRLLVISLLVTAVALAAGCGSSSSSGGSSGGSTPPTSSTPTTSPSTSTSGSGSGSSGFCGQAKSDVKQLRAQLAAVATISYPPARLKATMGKILAAYKNAEGQAPSEIKSDIATIYATMSKLNQILAAHSYSIMAAAPQAEPLFKSAKLKITFAHLKAWAIANCGAA